jgi:hypothetical protein
MKAFFIAFLSLILFNSCSYFNENQKKGATLGFKKRILFHLDSNTTNLPVQTGVMEDNGEECIYIYNQVAPELIFWNSENQKLKKRIPIAIKGPGKVGSHANFVYFYPHSLDSISVLACFSRSIKSINQSGKILSTIREADTVIDNETNVRIEFPIQKIGNKLLVGITPYRRPDEPGFFKAKKIAYFVSSNGKIDSLNFLFDEYLSNVCLGIMTYSVSACVAGDEIIISHPASSDIFVVSEQNGKVRKFDAASIYFDKVNEISASSLKDDATGKRTIQAFLKQSYYYHIVYDKYREVYYRLALHGNNKLVEQFNKYDPKAMEAANFSIIILDKNFNKIGETEIFDAASYSVMDMPLLVSKAGLLISENDVYNNQNLDEDKLIFSVFELIKQ